MRAHHYWTGLVRFVIVMGCALMCVAGAQALTTDALTTIDTAIGSVGLALLVCGVVTQELAWHSRTL